MRARHLWLVKPASAPAAGAAPAEGEPTPAERIRLAARRIGAIGRQMSSHAEELRSLTIPFQVGRAGVKEAV